VRLTHAPRQQLHAGIVATLYGCIPVLMTDYLFEAFEPEMPWGRFATRLPQRSAATLHLALAAQGPQEVAQKQVSGPFIKLHKLIGHQAALAACICAAADTGSTMGQASQRQNRPRLHRGISKPHAGGAVQRRWRACAQRIRAGGVGLSAARRHSPPAGRAALRRAAPVLEHVGRLAVRRERAL
jgi:hypothetical protein